MSGTRRMASPAQRCEPCLDAAQALLDALERPWQVVQISRARALLAIEVQHHRPYTERPSERAMRETAAIRRQEVSR